MNFCINEATTMTTDFATDLDAYSAAGFKGIELWLEKVDRFLQKESLQGAAELLRDHGLDVVGACGQDDLMLSKGQKRREVLSELRRKLDICAALGAPAIVVATDFPQEVRRSDYRVAAEKLREAGDIAAEYRVKLAVEFIKGAKFIGSLSTASEVVSETNHENVGLLFDTFHYHAGISKSDDIKKTPSEKLLLVHVNDCLPAPRELLDDSYRTYLGEGVIPVRSIVTKLKRLGYQGWYSFEIFNRDVWREDPFQVAVKARRCMQEVLT